MTKTLVLLIGLALTGVAQAQIKCWTTADGKRACGDTPPPGAKVRTVKDASASSDAAPASASAAKDGAAKDAKKGPLTPAEREQDYRKRQQESQKASAKADQERQDQSAKKEDCERAKEYLRTLESGQRIARTNPSGERYFLEENQVAQETAKARQAAQKACN
jgi:type IV secretory pathway VirB10-like protein